MISPTLKARDGKGPSSDGCDDGAPLIVHTLRGEGHDASEDGTGSGVPLVFDETQITSRENRSNPQPDGASHSLARGARPPTVAFAEVADPVAANQARTYTREGSGNFRVSNVARDASSVRRLTPRECERLQGFPDDWTLVPVGRKGKLAKDGPRYRAIGNSMAVPVIRWLGERIARADVDG